MSYQNNILIRTSLTDEGIVGQRNFSYKSPDMICHQQVDDPEEFFIASYRTDPNMSLDRNSAINYVYIRGKGLERATKGYVRLYACGSSLFMQPSQWKNTKIYTVDAQSYAELCAEEKDYITVTKKPFLVNGFNTGYYCMVAIVTDDKNEVFPDDFSTTDQFNYWVRTNTGVAIRNFSVLKSGIVYDFQRLDSLINPENRSILATIKVSWTGLPAGYTVGIRCDTLDGMAASNVSDGNNGKVFASADLPIGFDGYIETYAYNNDGESSFPEDAQITTQFYTEVTADQLCYKYGNTLEELGLDGLRNTWFTGNGKLILTGECSSIFK